MGRSTSGSPEPNMFSSIDTDENGEISREEVRSGTERGLTGRLGVLGVFAHARPTFAVMCKAR